MDLIEASAEDLRKIADALQRELVEIDIQLLDARKARNKLSVRLEEIYTELKRRGYIERTSQECA